MRFRTPPIFEYLFWFGALCLSPLIVCYFILAGLRKLVMSFLRLWMYPRKHDIPTPYDPDVESNAMGEWPAQKSIAQAPVTAVKFTSPTIDQVMDVKRLFSEMRFLKLWEFDEFGKRVTAPPGQVPWDQPGAKEIDPNAPHKKVIRLPIELIDNILDLALYWPCTKTTVSRVMLIGETHCDKPTTVWMDKERDWKSSTPGASKRTQPWRRTPSRELGRVLEDEAINHMHCVYLRTFPLGASIDLVIPETAGPKVFEKSAKVSLIETQSRWKRLFGIKTPLTPDMLISGVDFKKRVETLNTIDGHSVQSAIMSRPLRANEATSWALEIDELYPNIKPMTAKKFEKRETSRTKQQWRSFYMMSCFHRWVVPLYSYYTTTREEKFLCENQIRSSVVKPFCHKNILEPRLLTCVTGYQGEGSPRKAAKVRKIVWTIWTKEVQDLTTQTRHIGADPSAYPEMTWFEMFIEEPVRKSAADPEIVWKKRYPKGKENILVQRDLSHRVRYGGSRIRIHRTVWDWNDWEDTSVDWRADDMNDDEGHWRYHCDPMDVMQQIGQPHSHPEYHNHPKNFCNCTFGKKLFWGEGVPTSKTSPVSIRIPEGTSASSTNSSNSTSSSSTGSSSSSSSNSSASSSSLASSSLALSINSASSGSSHGSINPPGRPVTVNGQLMPNTVLEERPKTGSLHKNAAVGRLVRSMRMGDRLVLVARARGGLQMSRRATGWDIGVYRAEVDVHWSV
ncbi:hypothetical protein DFH27DRAFT_228829 [Peziza echinospora]|nr:hypothetical protein DFH27DRAFT_228829 [Peziza echinospora]